MFKLSKITKAAIIASGAFLIFAPNISAQQATDDAGVGIEVSSPIYEFTINPGDTQQDIVKIKNVTKKTEIFYPEVFDFKSDDKSGTPQFLFKKEENSGTYSLKDWVRISTEPITVAPGASEALNFYIAVPANAEPGGHYAGILFSTEAPSTTGAGTINLSSKVGSLILVRVAGDVKESAKITEFKSDKTSYDQTNVKFSTTVKNDGGVHVQPKGVITIKNIFGGQVAALDVNQLSGNILPGSSRLFENVWKDPGFKLGYYTATVTLTYGNPAQTTTSQTSFWILPLMTILIALAVIIVLALIIYFLIKRYNSWIVSRAQKQPPPQ